MIWGFACFHPIDFACARLAFHYNSLLEFNGYTVRHVMNVTDVGHKVLGLRLSEWQPAEEVVPDKIAALIRPRQQARAEKRWRDADTLRDQITAAGYEIEDTPQGPRVKTQRRLK